MQTRLFTLLFGLVSIVLGILGFIPALRPVPSGSTPALDITGSFGNLFTIFPVNSVHNIASIVIGVIAVIAGSNVEWSRYFCIAGFLVFGMLMIWGFIPLLDTLWRTCPIYGDDTWLDAGASLLCGWFGFVALAETNVEPAPGHAH
jgi:hypothetical protein